MKLEINVAEVHIHIHHEHSAPALEAVIVKAVTEINAMLKSVQQEIKHMADDLDGKLDELSAAITTELQQVSDAIAGGAAGQEAIAQVERAKTKVQVAIDALKSDDPAAPTE